MIAIAIALSAVAPGAAAPASVEVRLDYRGSVVGVREADALFAGALRSPRDSMAIAGGRSALAARLQALGYLDAAVSANWEMAAAPQLRVEVREGARYRVHSVAFETSSPAESAAFARALPIAPGEIASPPVIAARIERAIETISSDEYPYAVLGVGRWDADSGRVRLAFSGALGPRVTITDVRIEGLRSTRREVALRAMGRLSGDPYRRAAAEDARDRLDALGLFRSVTFEGLEGEGDWSRAHLIYRVEEPRYNQFEAAVGLQGQGGAVGLAHLELGNLLGTGRALGLRWESRGHGVTQFGARASEPQLFGQPLRLEGRLDQDVQDTIFVRTRWGVRGVYALSGRERVEAGYEEERVVQEFDEVEEANLENTIFAFEHSTLDQSLAPRRGTRARLTGTEVFKRERLRPEGTRTARASVAEVRTEWHRPLTAATGLALEVQAAGRFSSERILPVFERYPIGGATTLRGYDEEQFRVNRYALTRLEWGRFLGEGGQRAFLFWDHAWMATRVEAADGSDHEERIARDGFGFGLRVAAAGGLAGVDYGLAAGRPPLEGKIHVRLVSQF
ncbi:MAG: BamA/TamA family outer membrane protein [Candidatus Eisenbacteria bacterium]|nr:BamA/TamA family outer membrane protein [Candidatus Eisenbacteria bacterium]